jgi:hypothetical protein
MTGDWGDHTKRQKLYVSVHGSRSDQSPSRELAENRTFEAEWGVVPHKSLYGNVALALRRSFCGFDNRAEPLESISPAFAEPASLALNSIAPRVRPTDLRRG